MLHSGSRGSGNRIGTHFIELAKKDMRSSSATNLPDKDLAYFTEGEEHFDDYVAAVGWAQRLRAHQPRGDDGAAILRRCATTCRSSSSEARRELPPQLRGAERHFGADVFVTRKGAVRAGEGELGIIPGSMGAKSFIVRGKGNPESFCTCSHGAGRAMSRTEGEATLHARGSPRRDRRRRVPQGRGRDRRNADGLQGHRRRDGGAEPISSSRAHAEAGRVREGLSEA
jgi:tRNA-splicing ligase RtcB